MDLIKKDSQWFFSPEGVESYQKLTTLEERSIFIYSYLRTIAVEALEKDNLLFKIAFLLADGVHASDLPYAKYPDLIDPKKNPYVAYLKNAKRPHSNEKTFCILMSILHEIANPMNTTEWIYDIKLFTENAYLNKLDELKHQFIEHDESYVVDPEVFSIDPSLSFIQKELVWLFDYARVGGEKQ